MKKKIKQIVKGAGVIAGIIVFSAAAFLGLLTAAEYRPGEIENMEVRYPAAASVVHRPGPGVPFSLLSWNIGYAGLDESQDFFMDGGKTVRPPNADLVKSNLSGIVEFIANSDSDAVLLQEVDLASRRSYYLDEAAKITEAYPGSSVFAHNFKALFVPVPFPEFIGRVSSGLLTLNRFETKETLRISLPNPFTWPTRAVNLKRCLLVSRIPLGESNAELVLVNLHLEAYDSSGGREAQTRALIDFLYSEYAKGNYCIAGGDFNQNFPGIDKENFAVKNRDFFVPGTLEPSLLKEGWHFVSGTHTPSARLLNGPYAANSEKTQLYVLDGFIISPNVELLEAGIIDLRFKYSDHNPVRINVLLK